MGISEEIEVTTIPTDETTILETKATITSSFRLNLAEFGRSFRDANASLSQPRATRQARSQPLVEPKCFITVIIIIFFFYFFFFIYIYIFKFHGLRKAIKALQK